MYHLANNNESEESRAFLGIFICVVSGILVSIVIEFCIVKVLTLKAYKAGIDRMRRKQVVNALPDDSGFEKTIERLDRFVKNWKTESLLNKI